MDYNEFLERKSQINGNSGFKPLFMPDFLFDFQKSLVEWSIQKGKAAVFADCGLGKSPMELVWAQNIVEKTNGNVLFLTPLAVGSQMEKEAEKFQIEAGRSRDGKIKGKITITNYEQLHHFDVKDFQGVICDECFPADTPIKVFNIDNSLGLRYIKDVRKGDRLYNAVGEDYVQEIHKKQVDRAVRIGYNGHRITCSENHPFFTSEGWKPAKFIQPGDFLLATEAAMRLVWENISAEVCGTEKATVLRDILLSEMEDGTAPDKSVCTYKRSSPKNWETGIRLVFTGIRKILGLQRKAPSIEAYKRIDRENEIDIADEEAQTFRAWGQWQGDDGVPNYIEGCTIRKLDSGICYITGEKNRGLPNLLQSGFSRYRTENSNRIGRTFTSGKKIIRHKKRREIAFFRVDSSEVLELGHPELEKYRDETGIIYFYDIKAKQHPSFTVNDALVHNSGILKNFKGHIKQEINIFMRKVQYRLLATATAAPNDYIELGTSSEALGYLGYMDMLGKFFKNDQNNCATNRRGRFTEETKWRLKGHAYKAFWQWITSWARAVRMPSDIGYSNDGYILPELIEIDNLVKADGRFVEGVLPGFLTPAHGLKEERDETRATIKERCEKAAEIVSKKKDFSVVWCNLNDEGDLLAKIIPDSVQVSGRDDDDSKEEKLIGFSTGKIKTMIIKPKIGAYGLNWQHCNNVIIFPTHSYEQYYQSIRRCWRFGQKRPVTIELIYTDGYAQVLKNLNRKSKQAEEMFKHLVAEMNNSLTIEKTKEFNNNMEVPLWL